MLKKSKKQKYYLITSSSKKRHGAFPFSEEGLIKAKKFIKILKKTRNEKFIIKEN